MINISIDLTKIDKSRIKPGKNGEKYFNLTVDKKKQPDQFGNDYTIYQTPTKEERTAKANKVYLGSGKEFIFENRQRTSQQAAQPQYNTSAETVDDLPF